MFPEKDLLKSLAVLAGDLKTVELRGFDEVLAIIGSVDLVMLVVSMAIDFNGMVCGPFLVMVGRESPANLDVAGSGLTLADWGCWNLLARSEKLVRISGAGVTKSPGDNGLDWPGEDVGRCERWESWDKVCDDSGSESSVV